MEDILKNKEVRNLIGIENFRNNIGFFIENIDEETGEIKKIQETDIKKELNSELCWFCQNEKRNEQYTRYIPMHFVVSDINKSEYNTARRTIKYKKAKVPVYCGNNCNALFKKYRNNRIVLMISLLILGIFAGITLNSIFVGTFLGLVIAYLSAYLYEEYVDAFLLPNKNIRTHTELKQHTLIKLLLLRGWGFGEKPISNAVIGDNFSNQYFESRLFE